MGNFSTHYFLVDRSEHLEHSANKKHAEYGTANSVSDEKGTDNKKNNTSEYNHKYYEENKEKWADNKKSSSSKKSKLSDDDDLYYDKDGKARFGHKDYDENDPDFKRTDGTKIEGTDLRTFTNSNGSTIILGKGIKFSFPPGTKITSAMAKKLAAIEGGDKSNKEAYVAKMLNAITGFADKQKLNTDVGSKKKSSEEKSSGSSSGSSSGKLRTISEAADDYKKNDKKKTSSVSKESVTSKGKSQTKYYKSKYKSRNYKATSKTIKHDDLDYGSILVSDLMGGN